MTDGGVRRRLLAHIAARLVMATVLLGSAIVVQLRAPGALPVNPLFFLIGVTYAVSLGFIASLRFVDRFPWLTDVHFGIDAVIVSAAVFLTGGVESLFTILFMLPIVAASSVQFRRGGLQLAALSTILFIGLVLAQYLYATGNLDLPFGLAPVTDLPPARVAQYTVGLNAFGFFAVALLAGSLAERVRRGEAKLEQATVQIADLQAFNQYVLDNLVSGLATADADNRLLTFNRSAMLITGRTGALPLGDPAAEVLQLEPGFLLGLPEGLGRERSRRTDYRFRRPDGTMVDIGVSVAALPLPDGSRGYVYTFQDVTEIKRFEQHVRLQQRLADIGEMAAGIAHEIRNPLASMSGSMQMLKRELPLSADQAQLMDIVLRESERLNQTIRSFLAYARPQRVDVRPVDLRPIVYETVRLLRNSTECCERHRIEIGPDVQDAVVEADESQVRQIIWNLATNGLRAMPEGGTLRIGVREETVSGAPQAVLLVEDEGVGIAPEDVEHIFQPFRGSFGRGTGLGLAIVHRIVTDYGGRIDVEPGRTRGTTFRVSFPAPGAAAAAPHGAAAARERPS
jgi:two-component system sensor histidine kinase PilS (NtrC family)